MLKELIYHFHGDLEESDFLLSIPGRIQWGKLPQWRRESEYRSVNRLPCQLPFPPSRQVLLLSCFQRRMTIARRMKEPEFLRSRLRVTLRFEQDC